MVPLSEPTPAAGSSTRNDPAPLAPGQLASHYAPRARLRLNAKNVEAGEALLAFGPLAAESVDRAALVLNLWVGYFPTVQTAWNQLNSRPRPDQTSQATVTAKGKTMTDAVDRARERLIGAMFATWDRRDVEELVRLMRKFADAINEKTGLDA